MVHRLREAAIQVDFNDGEPRGKTIASIFEAVAEEHLVQPTIIYDFPLAVSPLSKTKPDEPEWVERFEFYIGGFELGNAFSELNDPVDQRKRFEARCRSVRAGTAKPIAWTTIMYARSATACHQPAGRRNRDRPADDGLNGRKVHSRRHPVPAVAPRCV